MKRIDYFKKHIEFVIDTLENEEDGMILKKYILKNKKEMKELHNFFVMLNMLIDTAILIQGPLLDEHWLPGGYWSSMKPVAQQRAEGIIPETICRRMVEYYRQYGNNVFWSTWENQDKDRQRLIAQNGIHLILNLKPSQRGKQNINCQLVSTRNGVLVIKEHFPHIKYVLKIRGDMIIENITGLVDYCKKQKGMGFMFYRTDLNHPADYATFGTIDDTLDFYHPDAPNYPMRTPEDAMTNHYVHIKTGVSAKTVDDVKKIGYFFGSWIIENNIKVDWLKYAHDPFRRYIEEKICAY